MNLDLSDYNSIGAQVLTFWILPDFFVFHYKFTNNIYLQLRPALNNII